MLLERGSGSVREEGLKQVLALVVVALVGFYVAWPAWSGYVIRNAINDKDPVALAAKVDFARVHDSLRPGVAEKVDQQIDRYQSQMGAAGAMVVGQLCKDLVPKIIEASLKRLLTPEMIIRIAAERGTIKESLDRVLREQVGNGLPGGNSPTDSSGGPNPPSTAGLGGLLGKVLKQPGSPPAEGAESSPGQPAATTRKISISNIRNFAFNGPLSFRLGIAKDPSKSEPDVTAEMSFTGGDWKLTGLVPRL